MLASIALPGQDARQQMGRSWQGQKLKGEKLSLVVAGSQPGSWENSIGTVQQQQWLVPHMHATKSCPELLQQCTVTRHWFQWTNSCMLFTTCWQPWQTAILLLPGRLLLMKSSIHCDTCDSLWWGIRSPKVMKSWERLLFLPRPSTQLGGREILAQLTLIAWRVRLLILEEPLMAYGRATSEWQFLLLAIISVCFFSKDSMISTLEK